MPEGDLDQLGRVGEVPYIIERAGVDFVLDDFDQAHLGHDLGRVATWDCFPAFLPAQLTPRASVVSVRARIISLDD